MRHFAVALAVVVSAIFLGPVRGQDQVFHRDKDGKTTQTNGTITSESTNKVVLKSNLGRQIEIPAGDIIDVTYELRGETKFDYNRGINAEKAADKAATAAERKKLLGDAIKNFQIVQPKVAGSQFAARHLQYKLAMIRGRLAVEDKDLADSAIAELQKFRKDHPNAWQSLHALKLLGQLLTAQGKFEQAVTVIDDILKVPGLDKETRADLEMEATTFLLAAKKHAEAEKRLTDMLKTLPPNDSKAAELRMMIITCQAHTNFAQAVKSLEGMIAESKGPRLALAYNALGDCYQMNNQPREALYNYLFVDLIYNEDPVQHRKAMENIAKLFHQMKQPERAKEYEAKLAAGKE